MKRPKKSIKKVVKFVVSPEILQENIPQKNSKTLILRSIYIYISSYITISNHNNIPLSSASHHLIHYITIEHHKTKTSTMYPKQHHENKEKTTSSTKTSTKSKIKLQQYLKVYKVKYEEKYIIYSAVVRYSMYSNQKRYLDFHY